MGIPVYKSVFWHEFGLRKAVLALKTILGQGRSDVGRNTTNGHQQPFQQGESIQLLELIFYYEWIQVLVFHVLRTKHQGLNAGTAQQPENVCTQPQITQEVQKPQVEELIRILKTIIEELRGEALFPAGVLVSGRIIKPVPLLITKVRQILDEEWALHENQREDWQRMYTPVGSIQIEELFDVAKQVAQQEADEQCSTPEAKAMHVTRYGNIVYVVGLPGVGKSTLLKQMINCIVVDKSIKPDTQFLFHVQLKLFNPDNKISLLEFLLHGRWNEWNHSDEENKALVQFLYNNWNVFILIDGWDELNVKQANKTSYTCELNTIEIPEVFVKNLLMGKLLPKAMKVITSRPGQFYELHPDYRHGLVSELHGMGKPAKRHLTKQICGEANLEKVDKLLAERPNLDALCSIPVHCIQIVACLHSSVSSGRKIKSMTDVFIHTLTNYKASDHVETNLSEEEMGQELVKLAHLAYKGMFARKLVFQQADFKEVRINEQIVEIFLHTCVDKAHHLNKKISKANKRSYFTHHIWQEFFSAVHIMLYMLEKEFCICMASLKDPHWMMVTNFMFGICNSASYENLKVIFPASMIKDYEEKKTILQSLISIEEQGDEISEDVIRFSGWVHEANDAEISQRFQECMPQCIKMDAPRNLTQVSDVVFAFNTFTTPHDLDLNMYGMDETSVETLLRGLHGSQVKIKRLNIINVWMTEYIKSALLPHVDVMDKLGLVSGPYDMNLNLYMEDISRKIGKTHNKIQIDIDAPLDKKATYWLAQCLSHVGALKINEKKLSVAGLIILLEAAKQADLQDLKVNGIYGQRWSNEWKNTGYEHDDVMEILKLPPGKFESLSKRIGSNGGTLEVGGCELVVPSGALEDDVEIKLTAVLPRKQQDTLLETPALRCEPSLTFKEKVTIKFQTDLVLDEETVKNCKLLESDDGLKWKESETDLKRSDNSITFQPNHFSWWKVFGITHVVQLNSLQYQQSCDGVWKFFCNLNFKKENIEFSKRVWTIRELKDSLLLEKNEEKNQNSNTGPTTAELKLGSTAIVKCGNCSQEITVALPTELKQNKTIYMKNVNVINSALDSEKIKIINQCGHCGERNED